MYKQNLDFQPLLVTADEKQCDISFVLAKSHMIDFEVFPFAIIAVKIEFIFKLTSNHVTIKAFYFYILGALNFVKFTGLCIVVSTFIDLYLVLFCCKLFHIYCMINKLFD